MTTGDGEKEILVNRELRHFASFILHHDRLVQPTLICLLILNLIFPSQQHPKILKVLHLR